MHGQKNIKKFEKVYTMMHGQKNIKKWLKMLIYKVLSQQIGRYVLSEFCLSLNSTIFTGK